MSKRINPGVFIALSLLAALSAPFTLAQNRPQPAVAQVDADVDNRRVIVTRPNERTRILANMRQYLVGLQAMTEALARDDMAAASTAARMMGSVNLYEIRLRFPSQASIEFHNLAFEVHRDFDVIAKDAVAKKDPKLTLSQLATTIKKCTHCHETYQLRDIAHSN